MRRIEVKRMRIRAAWRFAETMAAEFQGRGFDLVKSPMSCTSSAGFTGLTR
jgi:hypothetical protein